MKKIVDHPSKNLNFIKICVHMYNKIQILIATFIAYYCRQMICGANCSMKALKT
jgi:hypothetical protein